MFLLLLKIHCSNINPITNDAEQIFILLFLNSCTLLVWVVYLPSCATILVFEFYTSSIEQLISFFNSCCILSRNNFNISHVNWSNNHLDLIASGSLRATSIHIVYSFSFLNFSQLNNLRFDLGSILDLVIFDSNILYVSKAVHF